jgi:hypothetical protein
MCERSSHLTDFREIYLKKVCQETPDLAKIGKQHPVLYIADKHNEIFCNSNTVQRESILVISWQHSTAVYRRQLHVAQKRLKVNALLRFRIKNSDLVTILRYT